MTTNELVAVEETPVIHDAAVEGESLHERVRGKNINEETLLATDYLNHFNEIIMMLELVPSMPECIEDCQDWQPKSYEAHFEDSCFTDKELAILAYQNAPERFKRPFDNTISHMDQLVAEGLDGITTAVGEGDNIQIELRTEALTRRLKRFIEVASGIVHGDERTMDQAEIDQIIDD